MGETDDYKRTTLVLDPADQTLLEEIATLLRTSDMEATRRSIRIAHKVLSWEREGQEVILRGGEIEQRLLIV